MRKGNSDFINYTNSVDVCDKAFIARIQDVLNLYSYKPCNGTGTDIGQLVIKGLKLNAFNFSCGYYQAHSATSYIKYSEVINAYDLLKSIIATVDTQVFRIDPPKPVYTNKGYGTGKQFHIIPGRDYKDTTPSGHKISYGYEYYIGFNKGYDAGLEDAYNEDLEDECTDDSNPTGELTNCLSNFTKAEGGDWKCGKCSKQIENADMQLLLDEAFLQASTENDDIFPTWKGNKLNYF